MKPRFKPVPWGNMLMSARKAFLRMERDLPSVDGLINGVEWFTTFAEPGRVYLRTRQMKWFFAENATLAQ